MSEYLIKRIVEKDGLPKNHRMYAIIDNNGNMSCCNLVFMKSNPSRVKFYYEPITLPEIIEGDMPSEEEMRAKFDEYFQKATFQKAFSQFLDWLKTKLTKQQEQ